MGPRPGASEEAVVPGRGLEEAPGCRGDPCRWRSRHSERDRKKAERVFMLRGARWQRFINVPYFLPPRQQSLMRHAAVHDPDRKKMTVKVSAGGADTAVFKAGVA